MTPVDDQSPESTAHVDFDRLERDGLQEVRQFRERMARTANRHRRRRWLLPTSLLLNAIVLAALIAAAKGALFGARETPPVLFEGNVVQILSLSGEEVIWTHEFPARVSRAEIAPWGRRPREVVVSLYSESGRPGPVLDWDFRRNREVWRHEMSPEELIRYFPADLVRVGAVWCNDFAFADVDGDGEAEIAAAFHSEIYYPAGLRTLDRDGHVLGTYWHPGYFDEVLAADVDRDGDDEILAAGTNNAHHGATIVLLDAEHLSGCARDDSSNRMMTQEGPVDDGALARLVLPAWDREIMDAVGIERLHAHKMAWRGIDRQIQIEIGLESRSATALIRTDAELRPLEVIPHGGLLNTARIAREQGLLSVDATTQQFWDEWLAHAQRFGELATPAPSAPAS
ncbi:MAG: VCBS repeat-containing protein [Gemmatimonadetes bacterium]|nr:VCBS repeat-containing protein [Gemmatimonadota bacterium]